MSDMLDTAIEIAQRGVEAALSAGAREAEATMTVARKFSARARDREIDKLEQSTGRSMSLRVFTGEPGALRRATLSTTDLQPEAIVQFAQRTVDAVRYVEADRYAGLPDLPSASLDNAAALEIEGLDVVQRPNDEKLEDALALERETRAADARIDNSNGSYASDTHVTLGFVNSRGVKAGYRYTSAVRSANPVATDGETKRTSSYASAARSWADCESNAEVARTAASRVISMFGARPIQTQKMPVIFERDIAAGVLGDLFAAVSAANVAIGNSYLSDKVGEKVGSDLVTIFDDGRLPRGMGTSPFDGEGVPTQRTTIFERGVLRTHLFDTYYARKLGARSTGNASGGGISPNNFYLQAGDISLDELIARTKHGLLVLSIIGFATESATGTYSRGASGILIENGELSHPVDGVTIASNFVTGILPGIDAVASDLRFDGAIVSPSFRVAEMTVSGE